MGKEPKKETQLRLQKIRLPPQSNRDHLMRSKGSKESAETQIKQYCEDLLNQKREQKRKEVLKNGRS